MNLSGLGSSLLDSLNAFNLKDLLRGKNAKDPMGEVSVDALADSGTLIVQSPAATIQEQAGSLTKNFQNYSEQSSNIMARNFTNESDEGSHYLKATLDSFQVAQQMEMSQTSVITDFLASYGINANEYGTPASASMAIRRKNNKESFEATQKNLDEIQENIGQNAEETIAPKDAEGNPIPDATGTDSGAAPVAEPAPETVDVAAVEAGSATAAEVVPPEIASAPSAPAAPAAQVSIDIRV